MIIVADTRSRYRRKWTRWLAIYAAVAVVVYLVIYFAFFSSGGGGGGPY
jgi:hypothetical protein